MAKRVAVVLSGCGYLDGAEIYESVSTLLALDMADAQVQCFAPDKDQMHVVHHTTQTPMEGETRNVLTEASRLARGEIKPLSDAKMNDFDALIFPGGFGAAKNLCDYAVKGADMAVDPKVDQLIKEAHAAKKPICAICIAPVLVAKSLGADHHPTLTIGTDPGTAGHIEQMGGKHASVQVTEIVVDQANKIVTTPAYMCAKRISEVWTGVSKAVNKTLSMA
jgi:enhancing lycopene biosynthesis protein 2